MDKNKKPFLTGTKHITPFTIKRNIFALVIFFGLIEKNYSVHI